MKKNLSIIGTVILVTVASVSAASAPPPNDPGTMGPTGRPTTSDKMVKVIPAPSTPWQKLQDMINQLLAKQRR